MYSKFIFTSLVYIVPQTDKFSSDTFIVFLWSYFSILLSFHSSPALRHFSQIFLSSARSDFVFVLKSFRRIFFLRSFHSFIFVSFPFNQVSQVSTKLDRASFTSQTGEATCPKYASREGILPSGCDSKLKITLPSITPVAE